MSTAIATINDVFAEVFRPLRPETLAGLFAEYDRDLAGMEAVSAALRRTSLVNHFISANLDGDHWRVSIERLSELPPAIKALDAHYWQRALDLTDVLDTMPQARRDEWREQVTKHKTPAFDRQTVITTLRALLDARASYFAERVDGIFRNLSGEHLTNRPEGFGKRMIIARVLSEFGYASSDRCGYIHDLRAVIAKIHGREAPRHYMTTAMVEYAIRSRRGEWVDLDGGALRLRVYKVGTAHLEVHPEVAWKLNAVLAHLHPHAIPAPHRQRPRIRPPRDFVVFDRPIAAPIREALHDGAVKGMTFSFSFRTEASIATAAAEVLVALGGSPVRVGGQTVYAFDYDLSPVLREVIANGVIPDQWSHQFYPTPRDIAEDMAAAAGIEPGHRVLEPSAGQGHLARMMVPGVTLVEISELHCDILLSLGFAGATIHCADFLAWRRGLFDRIVMNPPYADGRAVRHLEHAASMTAPGGRIVALLPASLANKDLLPGWTLSWGERRPFPGTSIEVVILTAEAPR